MILTTTTVALATASVTASAVFGVWFLPRPPSPLRTLAKCAAVGCLAALGWLDGQGWLLAVGLSLSALGDAFLAGEPKRWLPPGLFSFLLAHAAYVALFLHAGGGVGMFKHELFRFIGVLAAVAAAVMTFRLIASKLGAMMGPVAVYLAAILAMVTTAFALPWFRWTAMAGALAFLASDGLLAVRLFRFDARPNRAADLAVWWLYFAAQAGIAWAFVR